MKKIISILMAGLLIITGIPFIAITAADDQLLDPFTVLDIESLGGYYQIIGIKEGSAGKLIIPETYSAGPVKYIAEGAFKNATGLTEVIISSNIERIDAEAFAGCTSLTRVEFFSTTKTIAEDAFDNCPAVFYAPAGTYPLEYAAEHGIEAHEIVHNYYKITYNTILSGEEITQEYSYIENSTVQIRMTADPKEGYDFYGWIDQNGTEYKNVTNIIMPKEDLILNPVYRKIHQIIFLAGDVDNLIGKTDRMLEKSYGIQFELQAASVFSRSGYILNYWLCDADGEIYTPGATYSMPDTDVHMTAVWSPKKYTFTFKANNGTSDTFTAQGIYREDMKMPECPFTKDGYHFAGWKYGNNAPIYQAGDIFEIPTLATGLNPAQFSAQWEEGDPPDIDIPVFTCGDLLGDGEINTADLIFLAKFTSGRISELTATQKLAADTSGDKKVNADDLLILIKYMTGEITSLPFSQ